MDEDAFSKKTLKTYSRSKNKNGNKNDAVFCEKALKVLKENLSISNTEDKQPNSVNGRRKRERNKSLASSSGKLKKPKQGRTKKSVLQVKIQKKASVTSVSPLYDSFKDDTLFGEGLQPVKKKRQSRARKVSTTSSKQGGGRQKKNSVSQTMSNGQSKPSLSKNSTSGNMNGKSVNETKSTPKTEIGSSFEEGLPLDTQVTAENKVSDWLAKSEQCHTSEQDTSKEVFRGAQNLTGDEIRCKLFPKEFFENLNCVLEKRPSAQASSYVKARQKEFLSQLASKTGNKLQSYLPSAATTEQINKRVNDVDDEDLMIICGSPQSGIQTDIQTETGTFMTTGMGTSKYTETQSDVHTGTGTLLTTDTATSSYTETKTGTQMETCTTVTNSMGVSKVTGTGTQMNSGPSSFPTETGTGRFTETQSDGQTATCSQFVTGVATGHNHSLSKKKKYLQSDAVEETFRFKDPRVQKYLCSTMRRSASLSNADFPSELSTVTDSLRNQQSEEKTPRKLEEDFKVPGSPTKCAAFKGIKKGTLQPKNSTKLFTTGFVEIIDAIPQMSTIVCDNKSKVTVIDNDDEQLPCDPVPRRQNIKTSTPNKVDTQGHAFEFEIDISSVNLDSGDEDILHFNESKEVNSDECIQLSSTLINTQQDGKVIHESLKEIENTNTAVKVMSPIAINTDDTEASKMELMPLDNEVTADSPKLKNKRHLTRPTQTLNVRTKVINKRGCKTQKMLNSRTLEKSARSRSYSHLAKFSSQADFEKRRSSRLLSDNYQAKSSVSDKDKKIVRNGAKGEIDTSSKNFQEGTIVKDVYDIDNSCINKCKVLGVEKDQSLVNDVFDIEESAINVPVAETQKLARRNYCGLKKPVRKKALSAVKSMVKTSSSEIFFSPKGLVNFSSTLASRSLDSLFLTKTRDSTGNHVHAEVTEPLKRDGIAVCTLMNEEFSCPRNKISLTQFKTVDTRSYQEILDTVPIDSLML